MKVSKNGSFLFFQLYSIFIDGSKPYTSFTITNQQRLFFNQLLWYENQGYKVSIHATIKNNQGLNLWYTNSSLLKMAIFVVDLPIKKIVIFHNYVHVNQRVGMADWYLCFPEGTWWRTTHESFLWGPLHPGDFNGIFVGASRPLKSLGWTNRLTICGMNHQDRPRTWWFIPLSKCVTTLVISMGQVGLVHL